MMFTISTTGFTSDYTSYTSNSTSHIDVLYTEEDNQEPEDDPPCFVTGTVYTINKDDVFEDNHVVYTKTNSSEYEEEYSSVTDDDTIHIVNENRLYNDNYISCLGIIYTVKTVEIYMQTTSSFVGNPGYTIDMNDIYM